jgi:hypothetical protein
MGFLKKIVKKAGKVIGAVAPVALGIASAVGIPGASLAQSLLPLAKGKVQDVAAQKLVEAAQAPKLTFVEALNFGADAAAAIKDAGGSNEDAQAAAKAVQQVAQQSPAVALPAVVHVDEAKSVANGFSSSTALGGASPQIAANSLTGQDIKTILTGAVSGAKEGGLTAYLDKTEDGKEAKKEAVDAAGSKMLPYILGAGILLLIFKGNGR